MFKLHVTKMIWAEETREKLFDHLYRDIELPFPPYVGLVITEDAWSSGPIETVSWGIGLEQFHVTVKDEIPFESDGHDFKAEELRDSDLRDGGRSYKVKAKPVER
jgi:hypothetical protein